MNLPLLGRSLVVIPICISLAACGHDANYVSPLKSVRAVRVKSSGKPGKNDIYGDRTSLGVGLAGAAVFGLAGALVFGGIGAINTHRGLKRWENVTKPQEQILDKVIRDALAQEMKRVRGWGSGEKGPVEAEFIFDEIHYGIVHEQKQRFAVQLNFEGRLCLNQQKEEWWDGGGGAKSTSTWLLTEYQANPRLFAEAAREAADKVAAEMIRDIED